MTSLTTYKVQGIRILPELFTVYKQWR